MDLYPAIDLRGGQCVRLYQGDFAQETVYGDDPVAQARQFADAGSSWIHVVDLDAARTGEPVNRPVIAAIAGAIGVPVQTGGGVRDDESAEALLSSGVARVVIGTAALERPDWARSLVERFPGQVALGLDVRGREVAVRGWVEGSGRQLADVAAEFDDAGFAALIVTQINVDGAGTGPDTDLYAELLDTLETDVIASGGVGNVEHVRALAALGAQSRPLVGAIVGKALYDGALSIDGALAAAQVE
ncbi:1-(5-phosphoribosyl)-5-[(5-phosphoribosylamino)methylideneamino]imidazole-4-carboxamide isomerase [Aquihabitans sp. G128]|uniref:1-(5-phosphoribosyl)-5-[(5- phosphoribosylamino)methylideneamino]imidazole-4- carboxamide isomerase n=1 Tax=Aquihabitans sp. G128 TaxID=2849779 RepID=UPI001C2200FE|nr:1-(5-phosphoribosyl)-5-[(5-phosphoribosylamino)methylideneamino]imidazole-4-carboxamide isomerase [Aquihabitans sp. G128]QXC62560.1 1-(5-phosphoribosyl)-5-[(5-phosphoribosylamino)methylideneamino]imidazole-4-carboxamide isomerase [Aquihabitans sp. G128]